MGWIRRLLESDDDYQADPEAVVTVGRVPTMMSEIVVAPLASEGITARAVEERVGYGAVTACIYSFAKDHERAEEIIEDLLATEPSKEGE